MHVACDGMLSLAGACLPEWDENVLYLQLAKREIESFRLGRVLWGIAMFPLNCGLESFMGLAVLPKVLASLSVCVCAEVCASVRVLHLCTLVCVPSVGHNTRSTL